MHGEIIRFWHVVECGLRQRTAPISAEPFVLYLVDLEWKLGYL